MPFVVDASVTLSWCFQDENGAYATQVLRMLESDTAIVPGLWVMEMANGLLVAERRGRVTAADVARIFRMFGSLPMDIRESVLSEAGGALLNLARAYSLSAYDAAYLELAIREGISLATLDERLRAPAHRSGVALV